METAVLGPLIKLFVGYSWNFWKRWRFDRALRKVAEQLVADGSVDRDIPSTSDEAMQIVGDFLWKSFGQEWSSHTAKKRLDGFVQAALQVYCAKGIAVEDIGRLAAEAGFNAMAESDKLHDMVERAELPPRSIDTDRPSDGP